VARPAPHILLEHRNNEAHQIEHILEADAIYAVFYNNKPINLKTINFMVTNPGPRYKKTSFSNPGHAVNLAERLNEQYKTDLFTVHRLVQGELYVEDKKNNF
jgi:hypothetical protein